MGEGIKEGFPEEVVGELNLQDQLRDKEGRAGESVLGKGKVRKKAWHVWGARGTVRLE